ALRVGVADYFQKPLDLNLLLASIDKILVKLEQRSAEAKMQSLSQNFRVLLDSFNSLYGDMDAAGAGKGAANMTALAAQMSPSTNSKPELNFAEKLSPRQQDVAMLIARGLTNYQIACELGISENTVKIY